MNTVACKVCGEESPRSALFCARCTSPVSVFALGEITAVDQAMCLRALAAVVAESPVVVSSGTDADSELFNAYLSALWLRPETALIQYAEARGVRKLLADGVIREGVWMDLGCGDGIHAALSAGWRFSFDFDAFQSLDLAGRDLFDRFEPSEFSARVTHRGRLIEWGVDIKTTAVARSLALGAFSRVEQADATHLPATDESVGVIFSNMLRDLGPTLPAALHEARRALTPGGSLVLSAMTPAYRESLYFAPAASHAEREGQRGQAEALVRLDRGRSVFCRQQLSPAQWHTLLDQAGLELVHTEPLVGSAVIRFWDVGLRPFSVPIAKRVNQWRERGVLGEIKPALLSVARLALEGLRRRIGEGDICMHLLVARRR